MSPFAHLTRSGNRADPPAAALPCGRRGEERPEMPFLIVVLAFVLVLRLFVFLGVTREGRTHQEASATALACDGCDERRQGAFVIVVVFIFFDTVVFVVPTSERRADQQATPTAAAERAREQEPAKLVFVVVFVLVFHFIVFVTSTSECKTHQEATAAATAYRGGEEQLAEMPLVIIIVVILFVDVVVFVFARFARERSQADHATAFAASQSTGESELLRTTHLFQPIHVVVGVLRHWPSLSSDIGHMTIVSRCPAPFRPPDRFARSPAGLRSRVMRSCTGQLDQSLTPDTRHFVSKSNDVQSCSVQSDEHSEGDIRWLRRDSQV
jgi:hypothetical protein